MYYAPQEFLADWTSRELSEALISANEGDADDMPSGKYERKKTPCICTICGAEYLAAGHNARYCPECKKQQRKEYFMAYNEKRSKGVRPEDVPDVPSDDELYYSEADKIKKTAPIETVLVNHEEDTKMDERAERLKTFPSMSNMTEHPEYFTGDTPESLAQTKTVPADNGTAADISPNEMLAFDTLKKAHGSLLEEITSNKKRMLLGLYDGITDICMASGMTFEEMLDRMSRLHAALS